MFLIYRFIFNTSQFENFKYNTHCTSVEIVLLNAYLSARLSRSVKIPSRKVCKTETRLQMNTI